MCEKSHIFANRLEHYQKNETSFFPFITVIDCERSHSAVLQGRYCCQSACISKQLPCLSLTEGHADTCSQGVCAVLLLTLRTARVTLSH